MSGEKYQAATLLVVKSQNSLLIDITDVAGKSIIEAVVDARSAQISDTLQEAQSGCRVRLPTKPSENQSNHTFSIKWLSSKANPFSGTEKQGHESPGVIDTITGMGLLFKMSNCSVVSHNIIMEIRDGH